MTDQGKQVIMCLFLCSVLFFVDPVCSIIGFILLAFAFGIGFIFTDKAYEDLKTIAKETTIEIKKILDK